MAQRIFDIEDEKDYTDLWNILPDDINKIKKAFSPDSYDILYFQCGTKLSSVFKINWHDKTEITRPIQEATEADKMKICCFWDYGNDKRHYGVLTAIHDKFFELENGPLYNHCRRLTKQEIEELC